MKDTHIHTPFILHTYTDTHIQARNPNARTADVDISSGEVVVIRMEFPRVVRGPKIDGLATLRVNKPLIRGSKGDGCRRSFLGSYAEVLCVCQLLKR